MFGLQGKNCLITGAAGSIGLATAELFHAQGANLVLVDLDKGQLEKRAREKFGELGDNMLCLAADITQPELVEQLMAEATTRFGALDVIFSNAGNFGAVAPIADYDIDAFESVWRVHVFGAFLMAKFGVPHMADGGSFIINSSVAATRGDPGVFGYISAKHGQTGLMRCLAKELAPRQIRVNAICPGPIDNTFQLNVEKGLGEEIGRDGTEFFNEIIPMGRHGSPDEIAQSVLYLASDQSKFTTGIQLSVDGGMSA